jgi:hypothetical protein
METLNTFTIDMTREKGERFRLNGEPIDTSNMNSMDIHIESGEVSIQTTETKVMKLGGVQAWQNVYSRLLFPL